MLISLFHLVSSILLLLAPSKIVFPVITYPSLILKHLAVVSSTRNYVLKLLGLPSTAHNRGLVPCSHKLLNPALLLLLKLFLLLSLYYFPPLLLYHFLYCLTQLVLILLHVPLKYYSYSLCIYRCFSI